MGGYFNAKYYTALDGDFFSSERDKEFIKDEWKIIICNVSLLCVTYMCVCISNFKQIERYLVITCNLDV